jgi:hypothetical protein
VLTDRQRRSDAPILVWFFCYQKDWQRYDVIASLITAAVVIPKAVAYATIAGLPVEVGLYTTLVSKVMSAIVGTQLSQIEPHKSPLPCQDMKVEIRLCAVPGWIGGERSEMSWRPRDSHVPVAEWRCFQGRDR